ncbi:MAG: dTMP kinase [Ignavibacteria bacterium]|nr:MAG: dTMP kinase [Ignavibacteria bacterium]
MFITFEGLDFCGKSTQVELLKDYLESLGKRVMILREPGGTSISEKVREILLDKENSEMVMETELLLFSASRAQLVREVIIPELKKGTYVISDRFHDSTIAYQGYGRGLEISFITHLQNFVIDGAKPDITFYIDMELKELEQRKKRIKSLNLDRIESSKDDFYSKVREGYLHLCETEERFVMLNGMDSIEEIHSKIINVLSEKGNL